LYVNAQPKPFARLDFPIADHEHLHLDARRGTQPHISLLRHNREAKSRADLDISGRCDPLAGQGKSSLGCRRGGSTHCGNIQIAEDGMFSPLFDRSEVLLSSVLCRRQAGVLSSWSTERSGMRDPSRPSRTRDSRSDQFRFFFTTCPDRMDMDRIETRADRRSAPLNTRRFRRFGFARCTRKLIALNGIFLCGMIEVGNLKHRHLIPSRPKAMNCSRGRPSQRRTQLNNLVFACRAALG